MQSCFLLNSHITVQLQILAVIATNQEQTITKGVSSCLDKGTAPRLEREIKLEVVWKMFKNCSKHMENQNVPAQYESTSTQLNLLGWR